MNLTLFASSTLPELAMRTAQGVAPPQSVPVETGGDFAALLRKLSGEAVSTVRQGEAAAIAGIQGGLPLQTVVERVLSAERALQTAIAVRDKAVSSYLEISRMQI